MGWRGVRPDNAHFTNSRKMNLLDMLILSAGVFAAFVYAALFCNCP